MLREDGLIDVLFGGAGGVGAAIQTALTGTTANFASDEWLERQYVQGGIAARMVDRPAEDQWARGFVIDEDKDDYIKDAMERLQVSIVGPTVSKWQSLYGAGAWIVFANDGSATFKNELNLGALKSIDKIIPIEASQMTVWEYYTDPGNPKFGEPSIYQVRTLGMDTTARATRGGTPGFGRAIAQFLVHETRLIPFPGTPLPLNYRNTRRIPWQGRSDLGACFEDLQRMLDSLKWTLEILKKKQQAVHKFNGLSQLLIHDFNGENEKAIRKQISMADAARNMLNGVTVDGEDDYSVKDLNLSGVVEVVKEFKEMVAAARGMPVTVLFGRSASGMHANGDNDLEEYYGMVSQDQSTRAKPGIVTLTKLLYACEGAKEPKRWQVEFEPLWVPSAKDQAQSEMLEGQGLSFVAAAITSLISESVISSAQATNYLVDEGLFGLTEEDRITDADLLDPNSDENNPPAPPMVVAPGTQSVDPLSGKPNGITGKPL